MQLPDGMHRLSPHLVCADAAAAIEFYQRAFGAVELVRLPAENGKLIHACVAINGSSVMLADAAPEHGLLDPKALKGTPITIHLFVADVDGAVAAAEAAGARVVMPVADQFWGDRYGVVEDPFGHLWSLATPGRRQLSQAELAEAARRATPRP
jgi:uncharacterized glyoxalase superfamily protein PhnB